MSEHAGAHRDNQAARTGAVVDDKGAILCAAIGQGAVIALRVTGTVAVEAVTDATRFVTNAAVAAHSVLRRAVHTRAGATCGLCTPPVTNCTITEEGRSKTHCGQW